MQGCDLLLYHLNPGAQTHPLEPRGDGHIALQVFTPYLQLARRMLDRRHRAQRGHMTAGADQERIANPIKRSPARLRESHAHGVFAPVDDNRHSSRLAVHQSGGIHLELLRCETSMSSRRRIHMKRNRRAADRILNPVLKSFTAGMVLIASATRGAHWVNRLISGLNSLISIGSGELVRSPI